MRSLLAALAMCGALGCSSFGAADSSTSSPDAGSDAAVNDGGSSGTLPCTGCNVPAVFAVSETLGPPLGIALSSDTVYVSIENEGIASFAKNNGGTRPFTPLPNIKYIAIDGTNLYGTVHDTNATGRIAIQPIAASSLGTAIAFDGLPVGIVMSATGTLLVTDWTKNALQELTTGAMLLKTKMSSINDPEGVAVYEDGIYVACAGDGKIWRKVGAGESQVFDQVGGGVAAGIAVDDKYVYFTIQNEGDVYRKLKDGTKDRELLKAHGKDSAPSGIAVDAAHVYWTVLAKQEIWRVAK